MKLEFVRSDLRRWTEDHPDWKPSPTGSPGDWDRMVASHWLDPVGEKDPLVLVDPMLPAEGTDEAMAFVRLIDEALATPKRDLALVVANSFHSRSCRMLRDRYSGKTEVLAPADAEAHLERVGCPISRTYKDGDLLPGDLQAFGIEGLCAGETVLYSARHRALIVADAFLGVDGQRLRVPPISWAVSAERYRERFRPSLRRLLDVPFDAVLVAHGPPVLEGGRQAVAWALEATEEKTA